MRMTERIITEDVEPSLVLDKLTSVASGLAGGRDEPKRRRERERRCLCVSPQPGLVSTFPALHHTLSSNGDNLPPPPSHSTVSLVSVQQ